MKNQDLKPCATSDPPVERGVLVGVEAPDNGVRDCTGRRSARTTVADAFSIILSFSLAICATASATEDVGTSAATSTPLSNHCRAMEAATSGLFWWSALITSTSQSRWAFISSTASCVAAREVGPVLSRYVPDRSVSTPITIFGRPCARSGHGRKAKVRRRPREECGVSASSGRSP